MINEHRGEVLDRRMSFDTLLAYTNRLSKCFNLPRIMGMATAICENLASVKNLPPDIAEMCEPFSGPAALDVAADEQRPSLHPGVLGSLAAESGSDIVLEDADGFSMVEHAHSSR